MARAHRLSGYDSDEEEDEFDELQEKLEHPEDMVSLFWILEHIRRRRGRGHIQGKLWRLKSRV